MHLERIAGRSSIETIGACPLADEISFGETTLLIGLGAPRTGSKWLSNYFSQHTEILMSPIRMLHAFSPPRFNGHFEAALAKAEAKLDSSDQGTPAAPPSLDLLRDRVRMIHEPAAFLDYFRKRWTGEKVFADVTPSYYALEGADFTRMRKAHSRVKFLLVMRNPIDRYWSGLRLSRTRDPAFDPAVKLDSLLACQAPPWRRNYATALTELDATTPTEDVKAVFFEHLFEMDAISDLCAFLGVRTQTADVAAAVNQSGAIDLDEPRRARLFAKFEPVYRFVADRFDGRLPASWREDMDRFSGV